jgi:hypothetical protein
MIFSSRTRQQARYRLPSGSLLIGIYCWPMAYALGQRRTPLNKRRFLPNGVQHMQYRKADASGYELFLRRHVELLSRRRDEKSNDIKESVSGKIPLGKTENSDTWTFAVALSTTLDCRCMIASRGTRQRMSPSPFSYSASQLLTDNQNYPVPICDSR